MEDLIKKRQKWFSPCHTGHNHRCRYTTGFHCEDCGKFIPLNSMEYFREEGLSLIAMSIHNFCCSHSQNSKTPPEDAEIASNELFEIYRNHKYYSNSELIELIKSYSTIFEKYKLSAWDSVRVLEA